MKLVNDWKTIVRKAWSLRLNIFAAVIEGGSLVFYLLLGIMVPTWVSLAVLALVLGAIVARVIAQPNMQAKAEDVEWDGAQ